MNNDIKEILAYMKQYVENKYEHDSEPMLNYKDIKCVLDYITNLQEENTELKELCNKYEEEHNTTFNYWKQLIKENYKSRNEKAIELINAWLKGLNNDDIIILLNDLGNILKGSE